MVWDLLDCWLLAFFAGFAVVDAMKARPIWAGVDVAIVVFIVARSVQNHFRDRA